MRSVLVLGTLFVLACGGGGAAGGGAQAGMVSGHVADGAGKPLAGAKLFIRGTSLESGQRQALDVTSGADGNYATPVPDGLYTVSGDYAFDYNGQHFNLKLDPNGGEPDDKPSKDGIVQDFTLKVGGLVPGAKAGSTNQYDYYGGTVRVEIADVYYESFQTNHFQEEFPNGFTAEVTFTPAGPLADGSTGNPVVSTQTVTHMIDADWKVLDIPIGRYTVTGVVKKPDGTTRALNVAGIGTSTGGHSGPLQDSGTLDFKAESTIGVATMGVTFTYGAPYPPLD